MSQANVRSERARRVGWLALAFVLLAPTVAAGFEAEPDAQQLLNAAFERRYSCSVTGVVRISTRKGSAQARDRRLHIAAKFVDGRLRTYAIFREPQYVRGMAFLGVESEDPRKSEQQFVYLPSMAKVRRVSGSQPTDSFLGTDLSYHDFQRQQPSRYRAARVVPGHIDGEAIHTVSVLPLFGAGPGLKVDFATLSFHVPIIGSSPGEGACEPTRTEQATTTAITTTRMRLMRVIPSRLWFMCSSAR